MNRRTILTVAAGAAISGIAARAEAQQAVTPQATGSHVGIAKAKQTTLGLYMTPREAADAMGREGAKTLFVDVRTRAEMMFTGWAPAIDGNVPFVDVTEFWDWDDKEGRYRLDANPTFSQDVGRLLTAKGLAKSDRVIVMCRSGDRSARAIDKLAEAGFTQVYNQYEGFEGDLTPEGRRSVNGWRNAGLPWTFKPDKAKFYLRG
ncbi:rhodanese-like domain-containing protein [Bosea sp. Root483D1]|uniref:rhodanese-like domain-containing protein n=1 Tax=Bosea sp. Root483D1 TaxID=1736544 RepID=UPI000A7710CB|nr:rhodanese-like domain-containing protein [Bosea sp. Root483D1]